MYTIMAKHNISSKRRRGGSNLVDLAVPAAFVYANNNYSKGTMLSTPKRFLKRTLKKANKSLSRTARALTPRGMGKQSRGRRRRRRGSRSRGRR